MPFERPSQGEKTVAWPLKKKIGLKVTRLSVEVMNFIVLKTKKVKML